MSTPNPERHNRSEVEYLRDALAEIAGFRQGDLIDRQADLMREKARIALTDSLTRQAIRSDDAELLAEVTSLWSDYCAGGLDMAALAQEIGEVLKVKALSPHPCQRCGSEEWADVDYSGCSDCREPLELSA